MVCYSRWLSFFHVSLVVLDLFELQLVFLIQLNQMSEKMLK